MASGARVPPALPCRAAAAAAFVRCCSLRPWLALLPWQGPACRRLPASARAPHRPAPQELAGGRRRAARNMRQRREAGRACHAVPCCSAPDWRPCPQVLAELEGLRQQMRGLAAQNQGLSGRVRQLEEVVAAQRQALERLQRTQQGSGGGGGAPLSFTDGAHRAPPLAQGEPRAALGPAASPPACPPAWQCLPACLPALPPRSRRAARGERPRRRSCAAEQVQAPPAGVQLKGSGQPPEELWRGGGAGPGASAGSTGQMSSTAEQWSESPRQQQQPGSPGGCAPPPPPRPGPCCPSPHGPSGRPSSPARLGCCPCPALHRTAPAVPRAPLLLPAAPAAPDVLRSAALSGALACVGHSPARTRNRWAASHSAGAGAHGARRSPLGGPDSNGPAGASGGSFWSGYGDQQQQQAGMPLRPTSTSEAGAGLRSG
jgi:hypothetical protein